MEDFEKLYLSVKVLLLCTYLSLLNALIADLHTDSIVGRMKNECVTSSSSRGPSLDSRSETKYTVY